MGQTPPADCPHDDWEILGSNRTHPMCGTCTKCGFELPLHYLLNNWKARVERELQEQIAAIRKGE